MIPMARIYITKTSGNYAKDYITLIGMVKPNMANHFLLESISLKLKLVMKGK